MSRLREFAQRETQCGTDRRLGGAALAASTGVDSNFDIRSFGAKGDGSTKDTAAIQAAIDKASSAGGTVLIPPGNYSSGTLHLKSNITLRIEKGARLMFSPDDSDFDPYEALPYRMSAPLATLGMAPGAFESRPVPANPSPQVNRTQDTCRATRLRRHGDQLRALCAAFRRWCAQCHY